MELYKYKKLIYMEQQNKQNKYGTTK